MINDAVIAWTRSWSNELLRKKTREQKTSNPLIFSLVPRLKMKCQTKENVTVSASADPSGRMLRVDRCSIRIPASRRELIDREVKSRRRLSVGKEEQHL